MPPKKQKAKKEITEKEEKVVEDLPKKEEVVKELTQAEKTLETWIPKTEIGKKVKSKEITNIDDILDKGIKILEPEIVQVLLPNLTTDILNVGQSKGKFGGGKRSIWKQTQKKTKEGNKPKFATMVIAGNNDGYIGIGYGKAKETVPAREKAMRAAKLSIIKVRRGCGAWACGCGQPHSIPFKVSGKCGSVRITLIPAPKGTRLCIEKEIAKILALAGIKDVYSKTAGQTKTKINLITACFDALKQLTKVKIKQGYIRKSGLEEGRLK